MADKPTYAELEQRIQQLEAIEASRKQAYASLQDSETRYRELFNHIKSGVAIYSVVEGGKDFIFKDFNRAGERLDGDRREDLVGKSIFEVRPGIEQFGLIDVLRRVWETGIPEAFPARVYQDNRLSKWYENFVYRLPSGEIVAVFDDLTGQKQAEEILRESEKKNQFMADIIRLGSQPVGVGYPDGRLGLVNTAFEHLTGYSFAELRTIDWAKDLTPPEWLPIEQTKLAELHETGKPVRYEKEYIRKDGTRVPVELFVHLARTPDGEPEYYYSYITDITARKQAGEALRDSDRRYRAVVETQTEVIGRIKADGTIVFANEAYCHLTGKSPGELIGTQWQSLAIAEEISHTEQELKLLSPDNSIAMIENRFRSADGQWRWMQFINQGFFDDQGMLREIQFVGRDITDRKVAEDKLRESEKRYTTLFQKSNIPVVLLRLPEVVMIDANEAAEKLTGFKREELIGKTSAQLGMLSNLQRAESITQFEKDGTLAGNEMRIVTKSGEERIIIVSTNPVEINGEPFALSSMQDITDRKQAEERLRLEKEKLDKIAASVPGIICSFRQSPTGQTSMPYASPATTDVYGLDPQDIADDMTPIFSRILPEDIGHVSATIARSAQTMAVWKDAYRYQHPTKGLVWIEGHSAPVRNADGSITWHGYVTDITARKQAEEKLKESEEKLRLLIEHAPAALAMFDHTMRYLAVSRRWIADFHLRASNLIGKSHYEVFPEITDELKTLHQRGLRGETLRNDGAKFERIDGSVQWVRWEMRPWYTAGGSIGGIVIFSEDITERKLAEEKLRESEARFQSIFENSPVAIAISRVSNQLIMNVNAAFVNMYGFTREEIIGRTTHELGIWANPADRQRFIELLQTQQPVSALETTARLKSGQERRVLVWGERIELRNEPHMLAQIVDISELKQAEEERTKLAALVEASPNFIGLSSIDGQVQYLNRAGRMLVGLADADMTQMKISEFAPPDSASFAESQQAIMQKGQWHGEGELINFQTRARVPVEIQLFLIPSAQSHQPITMGTVMQDISEKKRAELALRESEAKFRNFAEQSFVGFYIIQDGRFKYVNPKFAEIFGYTVDECTDNLRTDQLVYADDLVRVQEQLRRRLSGEIGTVKYTFRAVKKTGEIIHLSIYGSSLLYQGRPAAIGTVLDITKELEMEQRVTQSQRLQAIGLLAGGIAHDFNNILTPIVGLSGMLIEDLPQDSPVREDAGEIYKAGIRGSDLVKQILTFSRNAEQQKVPVRLQKILNETLKLIRATIPANINIKSEIQGDCGLVLADPTQIHQIAMNLITNAYHAVEPKNGEIGIRLREVDLGTQQLPGSDLLPGRYALLSISDTGIGIDPAIMHKIFEPYFTTKAQGKGTGLGLAVVYGIVKEHLGEIKVYSELGKGTTVDVYLPIMAKNEAAPLIPDKEKLPTGYEHILLIDDEKSVVSLEKKMLEQLGYIVTTQGNSLEALELFQSTPNRFDLVISDMAMPNMTGEELAREMMAIRPDIPIIICTGFSERLNQENAATFGVAGFLMKPLAQANLAKMVRKVLDARNLHLGHR